MNSSESCRELQLFELGLLANEMCWHFDQTTFALSHEHRIEFSRLLVRIRFLAAPLVTDLANSRLQQYLTSVENWLPVLDSLWFHEGLENNLFEAFDNSSASPSEIVYRDEMRPSLFDFRAGAPSLEAFK